MFPAHAGMNRAYRLASPASPDVPRTRGDEPVDGLSGEIDDLCSPHTRDEPLLSLPAGPPRQCSPHTRG